MDCLFGGSDSDGFASAPAYKHTTNDICIVVWLPCDFIQTFSLLAYQGNTIAVFV